MKVNAEQKFTIVLDAGELEALRSALDVAVHQCKRWAEESVKQGQKELAARHRAAAERYLEFVSILPVPWGK